MTRLLGHYYLDIDFLSDYSADIQPNKDCISAYLAKYPANLAIFPITNTNFTNIILYEKLNLHEIFNIV